MKQIPCRQAPRINPSVYFNIGEKKLRKIIADNLDTGFIIQNGVKFLIKRKQFEDFLRELTAI